MTERKGGEKPRRGGEVIKRKKKSRFTLGGVPKKFQTWQKDVQWGESWKKRKALKRKIKARVAEEIERSTRKRDKSGNRRGKKKQQEIKKTW